MPDILPTESSKHSPTFSKSEAIRFGFETTKKNFKFLLIVLFILAILSAIPGSINSSLRNLPLLAFLTNVVIWIVQIIVQIGVIKITLAFVDGNKPKVADLFIIPYKPVYMTFLKYWAASLLYGLIVGIGFILLIIPGVIFAIMFQFYSYLIVDKNAGPIEALGKSAAITKGVRWNLFRFGLLLIGINILGAMAFLVGLLISVPTTMLATAYVYRKLQSQA